MDAQLIESIIYTTTIGDELTRKRVSAYRHHKALATEALPVATGAENRPSALFSQMIILIIIRLKVRPARCLSPSAAYACLMQISEKLDMRALPLTIANIYLLSAIRYRVSHKCSQQKSPQSCAAAYQPRWFMAFLSVYLLTRVEDMLIN